MPIHINKPQSDYIGIHKGLAPTIDLSPEALGILAYFLTMPADWNPSIGHLKQFQIGDFKAKRIFKELKENHCLYPEKNRKKGRYQCTLWHASNVPLTDGEFKAMIQEAAPDHLPDAEPGEAAEGKDETTESEATVQPEASAETSPESLPEDDHRDVLDILELWNTADWADQKLTPEIENAIAENLQTHNFDEIAGAIKNYDRVRSDHRYDCPDLMNMLEFFTSEDPGGNKKWHQYLEDQFSIENYLRRDGLHQESNIPPSDDKREAQIEDPDPDLLPATQDEVTAESKKEASEDEATTQLDNPVEALLESLPEDKREEVQGIWALWNEMDEIDHEQWISHQTQTTEIVNAIVDNLEKHKYKGIVAAIHNYADVRLNDEFDYSESMNLLEFLTVEDADGNKKWHQFLEGEFDCEDYRKVDQSSGTSST